MKLSTTAAASILLYVALTSSAPSYPLDDAPEVPITEVAEIKSLVAGLQLYNQQNELVQLQIRSNIPILDEILVALKDSELANVIIDFVLLTPPILDVAIEGTIFVLRSGLINLTDVFIALEKSGLVLQFLENSLDDPEILPGLLRLGKALLNENGINIFGKRDEIAFDDQEVTLVEPNFELSKRESELLDELFLALKESGLAWSVVQNLLTTPDLAAPSAHFLTEIVKSGAISISQVLVSLKESNLVLNLLRDILQDKALLQKFGELLASRISSGIISRSVYDNA